MKKIYVSILVLSLFASSCNEDKILTQLNPNELTAETFYKSEQDFDVAIAGIYARLQDASVMGNNTAQNLGLMTDQVLINPWDNRSYNDMFVVSTDSYFRDLYKSLYIGISRANTVLDRINSVTFIDTPEGKGEDKKNKIIAEASFMRGLYYFMLVSAFENVPLILKTPASSSEFNNPAANPEDVWKQVFADFKVGETYLPQSWNGKNLGRATSGTATGYLGRAYLYKATLRKDTPSTEDLQQAKLYLQKVIDSGMYSLVKNINDNFNTAGENNVESLFEVQFADIGGSPWFIDAAGAGESTIRGKVWNGGNESGGWGVLHPTTYLANLYKAEKNEAGTDRSLRSKYSIAYATDGMEDYYGVPSAQYSYWGNNTNGWFRKFANWEKGNKAEDAIRSGINERMLRYADILLMRAEVALTLDNDLLLATNLINQVRKRADAKLIVSTGKTKDEMLSILQDERNVELSVEGFGIRWFDLLRWKIVEKQYQKCIDAGHFTAPEIEKTSAMKNYNYAKFQRFPIPDVELKTNIKMKQNPNW